MEWRRATSSTLCDSHQAYHWIFRLFELVGELAQAHFEAGVAAVPVQDQDAPEAVGVGRTQDILGRIHEGGEAQAERAGVGDKIGAGAKVERRGNQHAGLLRGGIRQRQRDLHIRKQGKVAVLFAGADDQDQAVVVLEVGFHIHPVQVFDTHNVSPIDVLTNAKRY